MQFWDCTYSVKNCSPSLSHSFPMPQSEFCKLRVSQSRFLLYLEGCCHDTFAMCSQIHTCLQNSVRLGPLCPRVFHQDCSRICMTFEKWLNFHSPSFRALIIVKKKTYLFPFWFLFPHHVWGQLCLDLNVNVLWQHTFI